MAPDVKPELLHSGNDPLRIVRFGHDAKGQHKDGIAGINRFQPVITAFVAIDDVVRKL